MGPLAGLKFIEMAGMGPAPFCGMLLADLGADQRLPTHQLHRCSVSGESALSPST
jgi:hypothetical protein